MTSRGWCRMQRKIKIKDAFVFLNKSKIKAGYGLEVGKYPFYTSSSVLGKYLNSYEIEGESLIFGTGGSASIHHSYGEFSTSTDCYVAQSNNKYEIDLRFVYFFLSGNIHILENGFKGAGLKHISKKYLEEIEIPLPLLQTQKKIVAVLDKAQALIDARKEQIRLMDELIQAQFIEMFGDPVINPKGWEVSKLKNHVNNIESGWSPKCLNSEAPINKWGILKLSAVTGGQYKDECNKKLPEDVSPRLGLEIKDGDLLLTRKNTPELVGDSCFVFKTRKKLMMPDIVFRIQTKKTLNRLFLWSAFNTNEMKSRIRSLASGSAKSMSNISKAKLYDLEVIVPNIDLQNDFEIRVRKIVSYKELLLKSLSELETYNKGLFKEAFISDFLEVHR